VELVRGDEALAGRSGFPDLLRPSAPAPNRCLRFILVIFLLGDSGSYCGHQTWGPQGGIGIGLAV
jgi:hypothetical protein